MQHTANVDMLIHNYTSCIYFSKTVLVEYLLKAKRKDLTEFEYNTYLYSGTTLVLFMEHCRN